MVNHLFKYFDIFHIKFIIILFKKKLKGGKKQKAFELIPFEDTEIPCSII